MSQRQSRKRKPVAVSEEDRRLFRDSVGPVRRIHAPRTRQRVDTPGRPPVPRFTHADEEQVVEQLLKPAGPDFGEIMHHQPGVLPRTLKKLRRGQFRIDAEIDLHAMTEGAARRALLGFLEDCRREGLRCVRVIHGKGLRSGHEGPVIKPMVERELARRRQVLAFCSARPVHGGTGAVYALLSR